MGCGLKALAVDRDFAAEVRARASAMRTGAALPGGHIAYQHFTTLLQLSKVHVYLTYPFSQLESAGGHECGLRYRAS